MTTHGKKKGRFFLDFLKVQEPSHTALRDFAQAQKVAAAEAEIRQRPSSASSRSRQRVLPPHVPKVTSKWDGMPERPRNRRTRHNSLSNDHFMTGARHYHAESYQSSTTDEFSYEHEANLDPVTLARRELVRNRSKSISKVQEEKPKQAALKDSPKANPNSSRPLYQTLDPHATKEDPVAVEYSKEEAPQSAGKPRLNAAELVTVAKMAPNSTKAPSASQVASSNVKLELAVQSTQPDNPISHPELVDTPVLQDPVLSQNVTKLSDPEAASPAVEFDGHKNIFDHEFFEIINDPKEPIVEPFSSPLAPFGAFMESLIGDIANGRVQPNADAEADSPPSTTPALTTYSTDDMGSRPATGASAAPSTGASPMIPTRSSSMRDSVNLDGDYGGTWFEPETSRSNTPTDTPPLPALLPHAFTSENAAISPLSLVTNDVLHSSDPIDGIITDTQLFDFKIPIQDNLSPIEEDNDQNEDDRSGSATPPPISLSRCTSLNSGSIKFSPRVKTPSILSSARPSLDRPRRSTQTPPLQVRQINPLTFSPASSIHLFAQTPPSGTTSPRPFSPASMRSTHSAPYSHTRNLSQTSSGSTGTTASQTPTLNFSRPRRPSITTPVSTSISDKSAIEPTIQSPALSHLPPLSPLGSHPLNPSHQMHTYPNRSTPTSAPPAKTSAPDLPLPLVISDDLDYDTQDDIHRRSIRTSIPALKKSNSMDSIVSVAASELSITWKQTPKERLGLGTWVKKSDPAPWNMMDSRFEAGDEEDNVARWRRKSKRLSMLRRG